MTAGIFLIMKKENGWYLQLITERLQKLSCLIMLCKFEIKQVPELTVTKNFGLSLAIRRSKEHL